MKLYPERILAIIETSLATPSRIAHIDLQSIVLRCLFEAMANSAYVFALLLTHAQMVLYILYTTETPPSIMTYTSR